MGPLKSEYLVRRVQMALFALEGWGIGPAVDSVADVFLMLQNTGHCTPRPGIGPVRIQSGVADTSGAVGVGGVRTRSCVSILAILSGPSPPAHSSKIRDTTGAVCSSGTRCFGFSSSFL